MNCPSCESDNLTIRRVIGYEPHGETHEDEFLKCLDCGEAFPVEDAIQANPETETTLEEAN